MFMPTVMVVDDDISVAEMIANALEGDLKVLIAPTGADAMNHVHHPERKIDAALVDMNLPDVRGIDLANQMRLIQPEMRILLTSGNPDIEDLTRAINAHLDGYIPKPFTPSGVLREVQKALRADFTGSHLMSELTSLRERADEGASLLLRTRRATLRALAKLAESRDTDTGLHIERVGEYSAVLAGQLAMEGPYAGVIDRDFVQTIRLAAPLHDIGKVGISDSILLKPGKLTPDEYEIMKQHTIIGTQVLDTALEVMEHPDAMLVMARDIVRSHHERWDGRGYPEGLAGEQIPLSARIVSVADTYDALTTLRPYKPALPRIESRAIITDSAAGGQFDPAVCEAFLATEKRLHELAESMR
jgi:putative two-component system response regulator